MKLDKDYKQKIKNTKLSFKQFSKYLAAYLAVEWSEQFYQSVMQQINLETHVTDVEIEAYEFFLEVTENPYEASVASFRISKYVQALKKVRTYLKSGIYNKTAVDRLMSKLIKEVS